MVYPVWGTIDVMQYRPAASVMADSAGKDELPGTATIVQSATGFWLTSSFTPQSCAAQGQNGAEAVAT